MRTHEGLVLDERYRLVRLIATGGMGQVWEGVDTELDRPCAVKILRDEYTGDDGFLDRFRAEARHTAALAHESVAALYDYGEISGSAFIVMELVRGRPLSDVIDDVPGGMDPDRAVRVLLQLARGLEAAHRAGVVHRDIKPENILVDEDAGDTVKITDFGIARSADQARMTKTGLVMGTAQYLSPEQAVGKQATSLSDLYALGIVGFEMLAGHRPFTGSSQVEIAMAQVKSPVPELPATVPADLATLVRMCLEKKPADRPRSASSVVRVLEAIRDGEHPLFRTGAIPVVRGERSAISAPSGHYSTSDTSRPPAERGAPTPTAAMPVESAGVPRRDRLGRPIGPPAARDTGTGSRSSDAASSDQRSSTPTGSGSIATGIGPVGARHGRWSVPGIVLGLLVLVAIVVGLLVAFDIESPAGLVGSGPIPGATDNGQVTAAGPLAGQDEGTAG